MEESRSSKRPYGTGEWVILFVVRALTATLLTALVGAIGTTLYETLSIPTHPAKGLFGAFVAAVVIGFPFILLGLVVLGLPTTYALQRLRSENAWTFAIAGIATGALWGAMLNLRGSYGLGLSAFYGCVCALSWWWLRPRS